MASELRVNTLKDASGNNSVGMSYVAEGTCKVWYRQDGTPTILDSFSVSSIIDNDVGDHTLNFSISFANKDNYTAMCTSKSNANRNMAYSTTATNNMQVDLFDADTGNREDGGAGAGILGDLA